jgi:hypothetical protein
MLLLNLNFNNSQVPSWVFGMSPLKKQFGTYLELTVFVVFNYMYSHT